ncbi:hypothetical protein HPB49_006529 [Dermacentor silvarum]|uniref:Uncharacterized protein n=1 Tax=Dermacentor silvarum TaxID=543639 RepID=A0ACB8C7Q8_DERSI|nr:hypothetical protein HPB49_006529 [Dermacentor silvarum]
MVPRKSPSCLPIHRTDLWLLIVESNHGSAQAQAQSREISANAAYYDMESTLSKDSDTEEQVWILSERLNHLHTDLRGTDSDIAPLLSIMEAEAEFDRVVDYNDRATATSAKLKYRILPIHESLNRAAPSTSNEPVQRTLQPGVHLPKIELIMFSGRSSMWPPFWEQFNQVIHNNGGLTDVDKFTYLRSVLTGDAALAIGDF